MRPSRYAAVAAHTAPAFCVGGWLQPSGRPHRRDSGERLRSEVLAAINGVRASYAQQGWTRAKGDIDVSTAIRKVDELATLHKITQDVDQAGFVELAARHGVKDLEKRVGTHSMGLPAVAPLTAPSAAPVTAAAATTTDVGVE